MGKSVTWLLGNSVWITARKQQLNEVDVSEMVWFNLMFLTMSASVCCVFVCVATYQHLVGDVMKIWTEIRITIAGFLGNKVSIYEDTHRRIQKPVKPGLDWPTFFSNSECWRISAEL